MGRRGWKSGSRRESGFSLAGLGRSVARLKMIPADLDQKVDFDGIQVTTAMISASVGKRPSVCFE